MPAVEVDFTELPNIINPAYFPKLVDRNRYLVLYGGA